MRDRYTHTNNHGEREREKYVVGVYMHMYVCLYVSGPRALHGEAPGSLGALGRVLGLQRGRRNRARKGLEKTRFFYSKGLEKSSVSRFEI